MRSNQGHLHGELRLDLQQSIQDLYHVFSRYPLVRHIEGCPCCTTPHDDQLLRSKPLDQLSHEELENYAFKAMTTLGTLEDFKHFLPRLLELAGQNGDIGLCDFEILLSKLVWGEWTSWPQDEREAIERHLMAAWRLLLYEPPRPLEIGVFICGVAQCMDNLSSFLATWRKEHSAWAARHLAELVEYDTPELFKKGKLSNAFWEQHESQMRQVVDWLIDPATIAWVEEAFFRFSDAPFANELSTAVERLGWLRERHRPPSMSA